MFNLTYQPDIKAAITGKSDHKQSTGVHVITPNSAKNTRDFSDTKIVKNRSPPSPADKEPPHKKLIMEPEVSNPQKIGKQIELTPELAKLRELLNMDMDVKIAPLQSSLDTLEKSHHDLEAKFKPLQTSLNKLEKSHKDLEAKGSLIVTIKKGE